jgi:hypothetical protein
MPESCRLQASKLANNRLQPGQRILVATAIQETDRYLQTREHTRTPYPPAMRRALVAALAGGVPVQILAWQVRLTANRLRVVALEAGLRCRRGIATPIPRATPGLEDPSCPT